MKLCANFLIIVILTTKVQPLRFFENDEVAHIRHVRANEAPPKPPCNDKELVNFLAEIQVINPESIMKLATLVDLEPSCRKVSENLARIKDYLKTCKPTNQPDLYEQLIKGVESLHGKICLETDFRRDFKKYHGCYHEMRNEFINCEGPADWNENSDDKEVCKAYKQVADCYYIKAAKVCGQESAVTIKELLRSVIDCILTINCKDIETNPVVKDAMPEAYIRKSSLVTKDEDSAISIITNQHQLLMVLTIIVLIL